MKPQRELIESPFTQGEDERIAYQIDFTRWGSSPSSPVVVVKTSSGTDVTATHASGSASVTGNVVTTPVIHSLASGQRYRLEVKVTIDGNVLEAYGFIQAEA